MRANIRTPTEPGNDFSIATLVCQWIIIESTTQEGYARYISGKYLPMATLLPLRVEEGMAARYSIETRVADLNNSAMAALVCKWIKAYSTTLGSSARQAAKDHSTIATLMGKRIGVQVTTTRPGASGLEGH